METQLAGNREPQGITSLGRAHALEIGATPSENAVNESSVGQRLALARVETSNLE